MKKSILKKAVAVLFVSAFLTAGVFAQSSESLEPVAEFDLSEESAPAADEKKDEKNLELIQDEHADSKKEADSKKNADAKKTEDAKKSDDSKASKDKKASKSEKDKKSAEEKAAPKRDVKAERAAKKAAKEEAKKKYPWAYQTKWNGAMTGLGVYGDLGFDPVRGGLDVRADFALFPWIFADLDFMYQNGLNSKWKTSLGTPESSKENLYALTVGLGGNARFHAGYFNPSVYYILNVGVAYADTLSGHLSNSGLAFAMSHTLGMDVPLLTFNAGKKDKPFYIGIDADIHYNLLAVLDKGMSHSGAAGLHITFPGTMLIGK